MPKKEASPKRRSGCPLNASVEILGDRWSLLIIRDMMLRNFRSYKEFLESHERIATNILRSEEHTSELQSQSNLVCRLLLEKKKKKNKKNIPTNNSQKHTNYIYVYNNERTH